MLPLLSFYLYFYCVNTNKNRHRKLFYSPVNLLIIRLSLQLNTMQIQIRINLIHLALTGFLLVNEVVGLLPLDPQSTFNRLCIEENEAKLKHDKHVYGSASKKDKLFSDYKELMDARIFLGSKLNQYYCPPELVGHLSAKLKKGFELSTRGKICGLFGSCLN